MHGQLGVIKKEVHATDIEPGRVCPGFELRSAVNLKVSHLTSAVPTIPTRHRLEDEHRNRQKDMRAVRLKFKALWFLFILAE